LKAYKTAEEIETYLNTLPLMYEMADYAAAKGIKKRPVLIDESHHLLQSQINAFIIRNILGEDAFYKAYYNDDPTLRKAVELIKTGKSWPKLPAETSEKSK